LVASCQHKLHVPSGPQLLMICSASNSTLAQNWEVISSSIQMTENVGSDTFTFDTAASPSDTSPKPKPVDRWYNPHAISGQFTKGST
jgi:hypothetical protein